ncbi:MAG: extracellular solute-binding protein [Bradyrhizobiaceae bacterium]|nr:extracellular solute-binding protein [Bradyrhizobiaceae bacterium]
MSALALSASVVLGLTVGCSSQAQAQQARKLSVITSAVYSKSFARFIVPKMKELYNVEVVSSPFLSAEALAKAIAQKDNPTTTVFMMDEGPWLQGKELGIWTKLDKTKITNLADVPAQFRDKDEQGSAMMLILLGLIYDEQALKANGIQPPVSLHDMWNPALRNRVSIQQFSSTFAYALLAHTNIVEGGDVNKSFDPAFAKLKQLRPNVRTFSGPAAQLIQLFQQKEIWMAWGGHFTAMQAAGAGSPVRWAAPKEGAAGYAHYIAIAKGAANQAEGELLVNLVLSPEYQRVMAETDFMGPANVKTQLDPQFEKTFPVNAKTMSAAIPVPWPAYNRSRIQLNERWQREIEQ